MNENVLFETTGQDWANHLSHEMSGNGLIYFVAMLVGKPDAGVLRRATEDLVAAQPVLGCRFDEAGEAPVWVPSEDDGRFDLRGGCDLRGELTAFLQEEPDPNRMVDVRLICCSGQYALCLRFDHSAIDGGGARECLRLLNQFYNVRLAGAKPSVAIPSNRSEAQIFERCGLRDFRMVLGKNSSAPAPLLTVPYHGTEGRRTQYEWVSLPLSAIQSPGCTVNDQLLAATARALADECGMEGVATVKFTVDLRRYLDKSDMPVACNLSGMESVLVHVSPQEPFVHTLAGVCSQTDAIKAKQPGLSSAAAMAYLRTIPYVKARGVLLDAENKCRLSGNSAPILTNLGQFSQETMWFGAVRVTDLLPLTPAFHAPAFMMGACGYQNSLTLSSGFFEGERKEDDVRRFLNRIKDELLKPASE